MSDPKPRPKGKPKAKPKIADADLTTLANGWSLVRHGSWEVSVAPDGLIMLPRHLQPDEVQDFIAAVSQAAVVGTDKQARIAQQELPPAVPSTLVIGAREAPSGAVTIKATGRGGVPPA